MILIDIILQAEIVAFWTDILLFINIPQFIAFIIIKFIIIAKGKFSSSYPKNSISPITAGGMKKN